MTEERSAKRDVKKQSAEPKRPWYRTMFNYVDLKDIPWAWLGWILLAAILYSGLLVLFVREEFWQWMGTLVATLLSVFAAIGLYRHQGNRAEMERLYRLYMTLDADVESVLTRIDPSRDNVKPLSITLPTGRVASAILSRGEDRIPVAEEVARAGLSTRREALLFFMTASAIRGYMQASSDFVALYQAACTSSGVGGNTEQALLNAASNVERMRKGLIEHGENLREYLAHWLEDNREYYPWGPENDDPPPEWRYFLRANEGEVLLDPQSAAEGMEPGTSNDNADSPEDHAWRSSLFAWRRTLTNNRLQLIRQQVIRYFHAYYTELRSEIEKNETARVPDYLRGYKDVVFELGDDGCVITHYPSDADEDTFHFNIAQGYTVVDIADAKVNTGPFRGLIELLDYRPGDDFGAGTVMAPLEVRQDNITYVTSWVRLDYASWVNIDMWQDESEAIKSARDLIRTYVRSEPEEDDNITTAD